MINEKTYKALKAVEKGTLSRGINAKAVALTIWGNDPEKSYLFTAKSNQGKGACRGKRAWLCAGAYMCRLMKKSLVRHDREFTGYYLTSAGRAAINEYEEKLKL